VSTLRHQPQDRLHVDCPLPGAMRAHRSVAPPKHSPWVVARAVEDVIVGARRDLPAQRPGDSPRAAPQWPRPTIPDREARAASPSEVFQPASCHTCRRRERAAHDEVRLVEDAALVRPLQQESRVTSRRRDPARPRSSSTSARSRSALLRRRAGSAADRVFIAIRSAFDTIGIRVDPRSSSTARTIVASKPGSRPAHRSDDTD